MDRQIDEPIVELTNRKIEFIHSQKLSSGEDFINEFKTKMANMRSTEFQRQIDSKMYRYTDEYCRYIIK